MRADILTSIHPKDWRLTAPAHRATTQHAVLHGLRTIVAALSGSARAIEARTGVTNAQLFVLQQLQAAGTLSVNDLAARARTGQSAVSIVVTRLVRRGLVHRRRSPMDGRRVSVSLSPAGRALARKAPETPTTRLLNAVDSLKHRDLDPLHRGVTALVAAMGIAGEMPSMLFERKGTTARGGSGR